MALAATRLFPSLPLLGKELVEAAARRRTYALRCLLSAILLLVFGVAYASVGRYGDAMGMLGHGRELCDALFWTLFGGVALLQPAISATTVTHEKEQGTLVLLLLTPMRPWELVLQKWLSRVMAMIGLLVPALPLMAVAYAHGGFSAGRIWIGAAALLMTSAQLAALSLAFSCWCRGSTVAVFLAYLGGAALYLTVPVLGMIGRTSFAEWLDPCPALAYGLYESGSSTEGIPSLLGAGVTTVLFLVAAWLTIGRRASLGGGNRLLRAFRGLDGVFERAEHRVFGRRVARDLPADQPVAWRETNRRSLANPRYLTRVFLPIYALIFILMLASGAWTPDAAGLLFDSLLAIALLVALTHGAGAVSGERAQQTLTVLLTTPMSAKRILIEKTSAMRRLRLAMGGALALVVLLASILDDGSYRHSRDGMRMTTEIAAALLLPSLLSWLALWIALRSRTHLRAVVGSILAALAWLFGLPLLMVAVMSILDFSTSRDPLALAMLLSPVIFVAAGEWNGMRGLYGEPWLVWCGACVAYALMGTALRASCLASADRLLRGAEGE
jgi:ABC-type transport system involved in multi-copper enzyme maturation permease subunit